MSHLFQEENCAVISARAVWMLQGRFARGSRADSAPVRAPPQPTMYPQVRYQPHAVRGCTLQPSQTAFTKDQMVTIDARGFRVTGSPAETTAAGPEWLALGDSFTFGYGVLDQEAWSALLGRKFGRVHVVNAGTVSHNLFQEWNLLTEKGPGTKTVAGVAWVVFERSFDEPSPAVQAIRRF